MNNTYLKLILFAGFFSVNLSIHAAENFSFSNKADSNINQLYQQLNSLPNLKMPERINWISEHFVGKPYLLGSLGEGSKADYDQFPEYRTDAFDCDTYVNTVLSLALANSLESFKQCQRYNRYKEGKVSYLNRNHFTSLDWNINNQKRGIIKDFTGNITDRKNKPIAVNAVCLTDKPSWYAHKTLANIRLQKEDKIKQQQLLAELKNKGKQLSIEKDIIPYLPFSVLFKNNIPNSYLLNQIPHGSIIEIIRPNWDLKKAIGTRLNVSHLGFAIRKGAVLYYRQASSQYGKVVDVPLTDYLIKAKENPTIKGINVQVIIPNEPLASDCKKFTP